MSNTVDDVFGNRYFRGTRTFMISVGQWPFMDKFRMFFLRLFLLACMYTIMPPLFNDLCIVWKGLDVDVLAQRMPPVLTCVGCTIKFCNYIVNHDKLKQMLLVLKEDWQSNLTGDRRRILEIYGEKGRSLTSFYATYLYISATIFLLTPMIPPVLDAIVPLNETRNKRLLYPANYWFDMDRYWFWYMIHQTIASIAAITIVVAVDSMYITLVCYTCGLFAVTRYHLVHIGDESKILPMKSKAISEVENNLTDTKMDETLNKIYGKKIMECVVGHSEAITYSAILESSYRWSFIVIIGMNVIIISITGIQIITKFGYWEEMIPAAIYTAAQLLHLFFISLPGQFLIDESSKIRDSAYESYWYNIPTKAQKLLILILIRSIKCCEIKAGSYFILKMETFGTVFQTSMSYLTVLASFG